MMPTEKRFKDFTIRATTGAEPVPRKPPNPATIITHDGLFLRIITRVSFSALLVNSCLNMCPFINEMFTIKHT